MNNFAVSVLLIKPGSSSVTLMMVLHVLEAINEDAAKGRAAAEALNEHPEWALQGVIALPLRDK